LGLVISENKVSMDLVKVAGVREWPTPENKTDVQAFLGFVRATGVKLQEIPQLIIIYGI